MKLSIQGICDLGNLKFSSDELEIMKTCAALSSDVWTGYVDGKIACIWGVSPPSLLSERAYLWLYTTELVKEHQFTFVRHSQMEIQRLLETYNLITGHCVIGSTRSIRWVRWLGATFGEPDGKLLPFQIRKKNG